MEVNFTGYFDRIDDLNKVHISIDDREKLERLIEQFPGINPYVSKIRCTLDNFYIALRFNTPCLIEDFRQGDYVKIKLKVTRYFIKNLDKKISNNQEGVKFVLKEIELFLINL